MNSNGHKVQRRDSEGQCETDRITSLDLEENRRVLYFSDGIMELDTDNEDVLDRNNVEFQDTFSFMSRVKNNFNKFGSSVLAGIDYVGEELASFLGITSKPEQIESYKQTTASINPEDGVNSGWVHAYNNNNGNELFIRTTPINSHNRNQAE